MVAISIGVLSIVLYIMQPMMFFFPSQQLIETPDDWGLAYEDVYLSSSEGVKIHGWYIPHQQAQQVVLFFHGNGGNISHRGDSIKIFNRLGVNVLIIDYQGYGKSDGTPGEKEFYDDARSAWQYLIEQRGFKQQQIILFGRSIGAAVATKLAVETQPDKLILESTFSNSRDMADKVLPLISRITMIRYPFNSIKRIKDISAQLLMLHSP
ncbi:MAG: alpha/beta fold hydrolase, partial [Pseudomonadota bacterium]